MKEPLLEAGILIPLLLFEIWNVGTAKRRGRVFLKLRPIIRSIEPEDFRTALVLNAVFVVVIVLVIALRAYHFSGHNIAPLLSASSTG
jgi:hypothetical protein